MKKLLLIALLTFICPLIGLSQATTGFHRTNQVIARGTSGVAAQVVPYASVQVTVTSTGFGATIYSDPLLSSVISPALVTADASGNYGYYIPVNYCVTETISSPGQGSFPIPNICLNSSATGNITPGTTGQTAYYPSNGTTVSGETGAQAFSNITNGTQTGSGTSQANIFPGSVTAYRVGPVYQVDQFTGATLAEKWNACNTAAIAAGGGTCDARSFVGNQYPDAQMNVNSNAAGNGGVTVTFLLPTSAKWYWSLTDGVSSGIKVFTGGVVQGVNVGGGMQMYLLTSGFNITGFTGTSGTLTFTTGTQLPLLAAGNNVFLTGCGGSNGALNGQTVTVLSAGLSSTSFEGAVIGSGYSSGSCQGSTTNMDSLFSNDPDAGVGGAYIRAEGFDATNNNGGVLANGVMHIQGLFDESAISYVSAININGDAWDIDRAGCGTAFDHIQGFGTGGGSNFFSTTGYPLYIGSGSYGCSFGLHISNSTFNGPGAGKNNIYVGSTAINVSFDNVYMEKYTNDSTPMVKVAAGATAISFNHVTAGSSNAANVCYENDTIQGFALHDSTCGFLSTLEVNDVAFGRTWPLAGQTPLNPINYSDTYDQVGVAGNFAPQFTMQSVSDQEYLVTPNSALVQTYAQAVSFTPTATGWYALLNDTGFHDAGEANISVTNNVANVISNISVDLGTGPFSPTPYVTARSIQQVGGGFIDQVASWVDASFNGWFGIHISSITAIQPVTVVFRGQGITASTIVANPVVGSAPSGTIANLIVPGATVFATTGTVQAAALRDTGAAGAGTYCLQIDTAGNLTNTGAACGGSGTFNALTGDATSTATGGATTVIGLKGVPFCTGFTPTNLQLIQYTTASSPNPCYTAATPGSGTVTSFSAGNLSPLFTTSVATSTTTPALTFSLSNAAQGSVLAGPISGGAGAPSYQTAPTISASNMFSFPTLNQNTSGSAASLSAPLALTGLATQTANTVVGNGTSGSASPTALTMPSCSGASSALTWTTSGGSTAFGCNTITASASLSTLTAATTTPSPLANGNNQLTWNWALTSSSVNALTLGETTAGTGTGESILDITTLAGSTAVPLTVINSLTGSQALAAFQVLPTWNTSGASIGIYENATCTSCANAFLMNLKKGGTSMFSVDSSGNGIFVGAATAGGFTTTGSVTASTAVSTPEVLGITTLNAGFADPIQIGLISSYSGSKSFEIGTGFSWGSISTSALSSEVAVDGTFGAAGSTTYTGQWVAINSLVTFGTGSTTIYNATTPIAALELDPTINISTSSTGGYAEIYSKPTETSVGTGITNYFIYHKDAAGTDRFNVTQNGAVQIGVTQTTVSCSTSGTAVFSQPEQGASDKKVLIHLAACLGTASYTYPTAFTNSPSCYASNLIACTVAGTISASAVTVTGATSTGSLILEDY